jgi:hypothetical protein
MSYKVFGFLLLLQCFSLKAQLVDKVQDIARVSKFASSKAALSYGRDILAAAQLLPDKKYLALDLNELEKLNDDQFLERIQYDFSRNLLKNKDSIAITENDGYRINIFAVAVQNGWMSRAAAAEAVLQYLHEYHNAETARGIFPRSFYRETGKKITNQSYGSFGQPYDVVGTAFFACSAQFIIRQFFDAYNPAENEIRQLCRIICDRIDWSFAYNTDRKCFTWFKNGEEGLVFDGKDLAGEMDETFFLQLLVLSSKNWDYGNEAYNQYVSVLKTDTQYGYTYFATKEYNYKTSSQFTGIQVNNQDILKLKDYPTAKLGYLVQPHIWFDFRGYRDSLCNANDMDYFENTRNVVRAQIKYAKLNPGNHPLYGDVWGFYDTYSPISKKWMVTGVPAEGDIDEGTISLNAVLSAVSFAPQETIHCLRTLYENYKHKGIYTDSGWVVSVNTKTGEVAPFTEAFFAPVNVLSIENYRSGLLWELAKKAPEYADSFRKAGLLKIKPNETQKN